MISTKALFFITLLAISVIALEAFDNNRGRVNVVHQNTRQLRCFFCGDAKTDTELLNPCRHEHPERMCLDCYQHICQSSDQCPVCTYSYDRSVSCACSQCSYNYHAQLRNECYLCCEFYACDDMVNPCRHKHDDLMCIGCYQGLVHSGDACPLCRSSFDRSVACICSACSAPSVDSVSYYHAATSAHGECALCCEEVLLLNPCKNNHPPFMCGDCVDRVTTCPLCRDVLDKG